MGKSKKDGPSIKEPCVKIIMMPHLLSRIARGDRLTGDDLLLALREHKDGALPEAFLDYMSKPLAGWVEKKPGPVPKSLGQNTHEKQLIRMLNSCFRTLLDERKSGSLDPKFDQQNREDLSRFMDSHLPQIDGSHSRSETASQLTALFLGMDKRQGRGLLNRISSSK